MKGISAVILTYNEELHIKRCIDSLLGIVEHIYVMDSYSSDNTLNILSQYQNVSLSQNEFKNHSSQFNHALDYFKIDSEWILRIDADEYVSCALAENIKLEVANADPNTNGFLLNRYINFMGKTLKHGGMSKYWILRIWRNGFGRCEQKWMDEHIVLSSGNSKKIQGSLIDENLNTLSWWAHKHVDYSTKESIDIIEKELGSASDELKAKLYGNKTERVRFFKAIYNKVPLFVRPFFYFIYRYFLLLGFLDGKQGFLWSCLQGFWYRMMVDAKVYELKSCISNEKDIRKIIKEKYGYEI